MGFFDKSPFFFISLLFLVDIIDQTFCMDDLLHKFRESLSLKACAFCLVVDHTAVEVNLYFIAGFDSF